MANKVELLMRYLFLRTREASTWRSLIVVLTMIGFNFSPDQQNAILTFGMGAAGLLGVFFPDQIKLEREK